MRVIVLLGAPGAGKGTQAAVLAPRLNLLHLATGDMFRAAAAAGTRIGLEAKAYMDRGELVPDHITVRMLLDRLTASDATHGVILDGFPRTPAQARALDVALDERRSGVEEAILIDVPAEELVRRLSGRRLCRAAGHIYNEVTNPPHVPGECDIDGSELHPGITTGELDRLAERHLRAAGATPSFKGYLGGGHYGRGPGAFPASLCISIDDQVVHGIPSERDIQEGQLVSVDAGAIVDGWHGDAARTFVVGPVSAEARELVDTTRLALMAGIAAAQPGSRIGDIGAAIEDIAMEKGYGIVRQFVGHGIGTSMHEEPQVPNFRSGNGG